jgi:hypothetical protein
VRYAMILLMIACELANADSITDFSGKSALHFGNKRVPLHQYAARLAGFDPPLTSHGWVDPRRRSVPVRFFLLTDQGLPSARSITEFERDIDFLISVLQYLFLGGPHKIMSTYRGCRKSRDADTCSQYNRK